MKDAARKYKWVLTVVHPEPHLALEMLAKRSFEMETVNAPPTVDERFVLRRTGEWGHRPPQSVVVRVTGSQFALTFVSGQFETNWVNELTAEIVGEAP